jgi:hypothetical protein
MPPVAPIIAPPRTVRFGDLTVAEPGFLNPGQAAQINSGAAGAEAQISTFARSVGIAPTRADRIAAAAVGGAARGAAVGCLVGAVLGGIGGSWLLVIGSLFFGTYACVFTGTVGALAGAAVGAARGGLQ